MGRLQQIGNVSVRVNANDHLPPHFHLISPEFEAVIVIETFSVYAGTLPAKAQKATAWAESNRVAIEAEWNRVNPRFPIA